jgi:hypothetical protein
MHSVFFGKTGVTVVWKHSCLRRLPPLGSSDFCVFFGLFCGIFMCGLFL